MHGGNGFKRRVTVYSSVSSLCLLRQVVNWLLKETFAELYFFEPLRGYSRLVGFLLT
jgi:hypothetical protein